MQGQQTFVYFGILFASCDLRVLLKFQGAHKNTVHFQGMHGQATQLKVRSPRNVLQLNEMQKGEDYDTDLATKQCICLLYTVHLPIP